MDRPEDAPAVDNPLLEAARYNDAEVEDHDLQAVVSRRGLDYEALTYVARQRALRVVLIQSDRLDELEATEPRQIQMSDKEQALVEGLTPLYIDAIFLGWRAHELAQDE